MIRKPNLTDAAPLAVICREALGHSASAEQLAQRITVLRDRPEYFIMVYADDETGETLGFIQAQQYELLYGNDGWNIIALAVLPSRQRSGIGKALLTALEQHTRARGFSFIRLNSRTDRLDAHGFYEYMGYRCDKEQKRFIKVFRG